MSIASAVLAAILAIPAPLVVLRTRELAPERGDLVCRVENSSPETCEVRVEALDGRGEATYDSGSFRLATGAVFLTGGGFEARSCRFTVQGVLEGVRAHGLLLDPKDEAPREVLPALAAASFARGATTSESGQRAPARRARE